ncbi:alpha/beta-hydrolase [Cadophora sp. DSE1049]|nr:alpha/beta-hydrolase [Cadophora sp. DSE1049]
MDTLSTNGDAHFSKFTILTTVYKTVGKHDITASILYPQKLLSPAFFAPWHLELAERESAVIVTPNYRFIPESSMQDILTDIEDFWAWMHKSLPSYLASATNNSVKLDLGRIMATGDSAGGFLSLHLGLSHPDEIRSVAAAYPAIDMKSKDYTQPRDYPVLGQPTYPLSLMSDHRERVQTQEAETGEMVIISSDPGLERAVLFFACVQHGMLSEWFPPEQRGLFIIDRVQDGARFPRGGVFVWHGRKDTVIPIAGTLKLKSTIEEADPELNFRVAVLDGEHGVDRSSSITDEWMADGLSDIVKAWLV